MSKPLTQPMFYILLSLKEPRHGYEIMQYVDWLTEKRVSIGPGTLYALLSRFEEDGTIEMVSSEDNKKVYVLTSRGTKILDDEIKRLELMLQDAKGENGNEL